MATKIPAFTTTCAYSTAMSGGYWYIYLKSGGTFRFGYAKRAVDIFLCGGGGGGGHSANPGGGGGGGGGYLTTEYGKAIETAAYPIEIGAGGAAAESGGSTSAFGYSAAGGNPGNHGWSWSDSAGGAGNAYGGNGGDYTGKPGQDGGRGTLAFGTGNAYYGAGGGGGAGRFSSNGAGGETGGGTGGSGAGAENTGGGGGGAAGHDDGEDWRVGGAGGSGIVIIRGMEDDELPVYFNGTRLREIYLNGELIEGLVYGGTRIFARLKEWVWPKRASARQLADA